MGSGGAPQPGLSARPATPAGGSGQSTALAEPRFPHLKVAVRAPTAPGCYEEAEGTVGHGHSPAVTAGSSWCSVGRAVGKASQWPNLL